MKYRFRKPSPGKFLCVMWNHVATTYLKFVTWRSFFVNKKIEKIHVDSKKSINSLTIIKQSSPGYLWEYYFFRQFVNNFSALLLCKKYVFDIFNMVDFSFNFCYISKYWNSDCIKHLARSVYVKHLWVIN